MKSLKLKTDKKESDIFPILLEFVGLQDPHVVMFVKEQEGFVVYTGSSGWPVGYYSTKWERYDDFTSWKPFHGTVTLEN